MFDFDFDAMEPEPTAAPGSPEVPVARISFAAALGASVAGARSGDVELEIATLGGGVVANLQVPSSTTAQSLKERLEKVLGMRATEQHLAAGTLIFDGAQCLQELLRPAELGRSLRLTAVHVPGARRVAVSGSRDGSLRVWDLNRSYAMRELSAHGPGVTCLAAKWAARRALSGGLDGLLRLWDLEKGRAIRQFAGHRAGVTCLAADWAAERAISGDEDGALRLWDLERGTVVQEFLGHAGAVLCVNLGIEANSAISGSADMTLRLWLLETGETFLQFPGHTPVNCLDANLELRPNPVAVAGSFAILRFWSHAWLSIGKHLQSPAVVPIRPFSAAG